MKTPEPSPENLRNILPGRLPTESRAAGSLPFEPRYVDVPPASISTGGLNLRWGIFCLALALFLMLVAARLAGPRALVPLLASLLTVTLLWVLARLRLFKQRNGGFLAVGLACLLGSLMGLSEWSYTRIGHSSTPSSQSAEEAAVAPIPAVRAEPVVIPLSKELGIVQPQMISGSHVKILKSQNVNIGRKLYRVEVGELYLLQALQNGNVVFSAKELQFTVPNSVVEIFQVSSSESAADSTAQLPADPVSEPSAAPPESETAAQVTQRAQKEALRRYPALGIKDSPENILFVETYRELRNSGSDALKDAEWPIHLADSLARREGWERK